MSTGLARALAEKYGIVLDLVGGDRLHWQSHGPTPDGALASLKATKGELIDLLVRYRLDSEGGLVGDDLLALQAKGLAVRRYGANAALDGISGAADRVPKALLNAFADKQAEYGLALRALRAPDCLERNLDDARCDESAATGSTMDQADEKPPSTVAATALLRHLRRMGFRACLDQGTLYIADTTGRWRDPFRFISPTLVFDVLNVGLDDDPGLLDPRGDSR
jgi:hypothetical protein